MEFVLVLAAGLGIYFFLKSNTRRGSETVRAYVYLGRLAAGGSQDEANSAASGNMMDGPEHVIRDAMAAVKSDYGGKQRSMIAEAYRLGMWSRKPNTASKIIEANTDAAQTVTPDWTIPFILYYLTWEMRIAGEGNMPDAVRALATGKVSPHQQQGLLASLQNYLSFSGKRKLAVGDYDLVVREAHDFLQAELRTLNSPLATKRFIRKEHKKATGTEITEDELKAQFNEISEDVRNNDEAGLKLRNLLLNDSLDETFTTKYGKRVEVFSREMTAYFDTVDDGL
ncbi:hypothetical protein [Mesorhizobium sp. A623]